MTYGPRWLARRWRPANFARRCVRFFWRSLRSWLPTDLSRWSDGSPIVTMKRSSVEKLNIAPTCSHCLRRAVLGLNAAGTGRITSRPRTWKATTASTKGSSMQRHTIYSASSHKWEAYRRRRFGRFSRRERRSYLDLYVRSEQRGKSAKAPSALRVGLKRVRLRRGSFVTYRSGYAPHSRLPFCARA